MLEKYAVTNYIAFAIPVFFLLIFIELVAAFFMKKKLYRINDSITDLSLGTYSRVFGKFYGLFFLLLYIYIYENYRIWHLGYESVFAWVFGFFAVDFLYYWFHRASHQIAIIWGSHDPHHSSEEYNLSVALRQGSFQGVFSFWFYLPLAFIGLHPVVFFTHSQFNTLYQFWIHTRIIGKMGFLEWFLCTPSHHRVHHGRNPEYIDKNHGGTLIIWDRLFGTFQEEKQEPVYGIVKPLGSFNPMWANFHYWRYLIGLTKRARGFDKIKIWFKGPGYKPDYLGGESQVPQISRDTQVLYNPPLATSTGIYALLQFLFTTPVILKLVFMGPEAFSITGGLLAVIILGSLLSLGWVLENRILGRTTEISRLSLFSALGGYLLVTGPFDWQIAVFTVLSSVSLVLAMVMIKADIDNSSSLRATA